MAIKQLGAAQLWPYHFIIRLLLRLLLTIRILRENFEVWHNSRWDRLRVAAFGLRCISGVPLFEQGLISRCQHEILQTLCNLARLRRLRLYWLHINSSSTIAFLTWLALRTDRIRGWLLRECHKWWACRTDRATSLDRFSHSGDDWDYWWLQVLKLVVNNFSVAIIGTVVLVVVSWSRWSWTTLKRQAVFI